VNPGRSRPTAVAVLAGDRGGGVVVAVASPWVRERVLVARRPQLNILPSAPVVG